MHGTFVVQRLHSHSGLNTVEQLPSDYMWEMVESFEKRLGEYAQASDSLGSRYVPNPYPARRLPPTP